MHVAWTERFEGWIAEQGGGLLVHPPAGGGAVPVVRAGAPADPSLYRRFGGGEVRVWVRRDADLGLHRALSLDLVDGVPTADVARTPRRGGGSVDSSANRQSLG